MEIELHFVNFFKDSLSKIATDYHSRVSVLEEQKYDHEFQVGMKELEASTEFRLNFAKIILFLP